MLRGILSEGRDVTLVAAGVDKLPFIFHQIPLLLPCSKLQAPNRRGASSQSSTAAFLTGLRVMRCRHAAAAHVLLLADVYLDRLIDSATVARALSPSALFPHSVTRPMLVNTFVLRSCGRSSVCRAQQARARAR